MEHQPRTSRLHGPVAAPSTLHDASPVPIDTSVVGTVLGGRYRVGECIGAGAMGVVFTAWDRRLRRTVAVKQLAARHRDATEEHVARARAMREGRIAARVVHPRAIAVFDVVVDGDHGSGHGPWLVMEYLPSRSLAAVLAEQGPLEPREAAWVGAQVADALGAVHEAGIVHGDIKPGNVLITDDGVAKITDFGVSRATWDTTSTGGGMVAGTPGYFAPEVARGGDPSPASDVFSLGATLYAAVENELVCGSHDNTLAVLHAMAEGRLRPATRAGVLGRPLAAMLRLDPEHRPGTGAVERALRARAGTQPFIPAPRRAPAESPDADGAAAGAAGGAAGAGAAVAGADPDPAGVPAPRRPGTADLPPTAGALPALTPDPGMDPEMDPAVEPTHAPSAGEADGIDPDEPAATPTPAAASGPAVGPERVGGLGATAAASSPARPGFVTAPTRAVASGSDRRRPSRWSRPRRATAVAAASAVVLAGGIGVAVAAGTGTGTVAAPAPAPVPTSAPPEPAPADPLGGTDPEMPTPSVAAPLSPNDPSDLLSSGDPATVVVDYYAALPGNIDGAWAVLSDEARDESGGYEGYQRFWSSIREVRTSNVSVRGDTVTADIEFTTERGRTSRENYRFEVDRDDDGQVRIQRAQRSSDSS
ncbi:serine/threonine-protein kinase [Actinomycetospora lemnae]|uniref:non-specific serine/threonine protein kinase n=1 Tax=Actinomycetospora lemnae TaxID=3019891 RepID=A0ABT5SNX6_9PSEU|nr:serine/threonine-protein kinase [Actinomycetospora sp. DW7H6]MDD7964538.1 protein kinase [Actinomycetospora sp. DW7H6]